MRLVPAGLALGLLAVSATAPAQESPTTPPPAQITDIAGDANSVNRQNQLGDELPTEGLSTPASYGPADLVSIAFATEYEVVKVFRTNGTVKSVEYRPTHLRVAVTTSERPDVPNEVLAIVFHVFFETPLCGGLELTVHVRGTGETFGRITSSGGSCSVPNGIGAAEVTDSGVTARFALDDLPSFLNVGSTIRPRPSRASSGGDIRLEPGTRFHLRPTSSTQWIALTAWLDLARFDSPFTIGQDVPPKVDCDLSPAHEACRSGA